MRYRMAKSSYSLVHPLQDGRCDEGRLLLLGIGSHEPDLLPFLAHGHALLGNATFVIGNQRISRIHDIPCGAVIALQTEGYRLREVLLEVQDVLNLGTAEGGKVKSHLELVEQNGYCRSVTIHHSPKSLSVALVEPFLVHVVNYSHKGFHEKPCLARNHTLGVPQEQGLDKSGIGRT